MTDEKVGSIAVRIYLCPKRCYAFLIESVVSVSLGCPILKEVLGRVGAAVDLGHILDCLVLDL